VLRAKATAQLPDRYILHLGALEPRKNLGVLLDAYAALPGQIRTNCRLVLAGPIGWGERSFWAELRDHPVAAQVLATGRVGDEDVGLLLAGATALVAPSRYEGFGLPLLEAMACGTPVLCSTAEAFKEIADNAAEMIHPDDIHGWTSAIRRAVEEPGWLAGMTAAGRRRSEKYSWEVTARMHLQVLAKVAFA